MSLFLKINQTWTHMILNWKVPHKNYPYNTKNKLSILQLPCGRNSRKKKHQLPQYKTPKNNNKALKAFKWGKSI